MQIATTAALAIQPPSNATKAVNESWAATLNFMKSSGVISKAPVTSQLPEVELFIDAEVDTKSTVRFQGSSEDSVIAELTFGFED